MIDCDLSKEGVAMQVSRSGLLLELVVVALTLAACGGGGGSSSSGGGGPSAQDVIPFSNTAGRWWASGSGATWRGRTVHRFDHSWSMFAASTETEYRWFDGTAIRSVTAVADVPGRSGPPDYAELAAPIKEGVAQDVYDTTETVDADGDGRLDTLRIQITVTSTRVATLSVAAGDFRNVVSARRDIKATVTTAAGLSDSATAMLTTWYAPGVGIVRRVYLDPGATKNSSECPWAACAQACSPLRRC
jgi:hypothetical protein